MAKVDDPATALTGGARGDCPRPDLGGPGRRDRDPTRLVAQSLGGYMRAWLARLRNGDSGVLPVILAIVIIAVGFRSATASFLSAGNLVNLLEQSTVFMVLAMAEIFALLLAEIDLSVGLVMGLGAVVVCELVQPPPSGLNWPWWLAIAGALLLCAAVGAHSGNAGRPPQDALVHRHPRRTADPRGHRHHHPGRLGPRRHLQSGLQQRGRSLRHLLGEVRSHLQLDRARRGAGGDRRGVLARQLTQTPEWSGRPSGEPDRTQDRAPGGRRDRCRRDLQREPGALRSHRRCALDHPHRSRGARGVDDPPAADPFRPLRVRDRRQPRGSAPRRGRACRSSARGASSSPHSPPGSPASCSPRGRCR